MLNCKHLLPALTQGTLIKRYKRFLVDINSKDGISTLHCPNSGSMRGLLSEGAPLWFSTSHSPTRKLPSTLEIIESDNTLVGVNTHRANKIVLNALQQTSEHPHFGAIQNIKAEHKTGNSRIDFLLETSNGNFYVEVKNVTMKEGAYATFPDAVTERGKKHVLHLTELAKNKHRCAIIFLIQRSDCSAFQPAHHIDPAFAHALLEAHKSGVIILPYACTISTESVFISELLPIII